MGSKMTHEAAYYINCSKVTIDEMGQGLKVNRKVLKRWLDEVEAYFGDEGSSFNPAEMPDGENYMPVFVLDTRIVVTTGERIDIRVLTDASIENCPSYAFVDYTGEMEFSYEASDDEDLSRLSILNDFTDETPIETYE